MTTDRYAYWNDALAGRFAGVTESNPQPGFYRMKAAGGFWLPVALWDEDTATWLKVGNEDATATEITVHGAWMRCAKYPVSEDAYRTAIETGQWPGEAPAAPGIGDNNPPDGFDAFSAWLNEQIAEAQGWLNGRTIATQADADKCERLANELLAARKKAETEHKAEKQPHLEAGRAVDAKWKPLIDGASTMVRRLKDGVTNFLRAREEEKKAAAAAQIAAGAPPPTRLDTRATTAGVSGKKIALRTVKFAQVEDWDAAIAFFTGNPDLRALVQRLADQCAKVGAPVPGVKIVEEQRAA